MFNVELRQQCQPLTFRQVPATHRPQITNDASLFHWLRAANDQNSGLALGDAEHNKEIYVFFCDLHSKYWVNARFFEDRPERLNKYEYGSGDFVYSVRRVCNRSILRETVSLLERIQMLLKSRGGGEYRGIVMAAEGP